MDNLSTTSIPTFLEYRKYRRITWHFRYVNGGLYFSVLPNKMVFGSSSKLPLDSYNKHSEKLTECNSSTLYMDYEKMSK